MKIGIIGSNGFIGNNLYFYLSKFKNYKVFRYSSFKKNNKYWINKVSQEIKTTKPNIILNCAANQSLKNDKKSIKDLLYSNLYSNIYFLEQATQNNLFKGYISFGTKWEFNQNMEFNPLNFYSATKHANDIFFNYFSQKKNICTVSLKIFDTYGPNDKRSKILNLIIDSIKKNKTLKLTPGDQYLDYVHINDLSELVSKICSDINNSQFSEVYNKIKGEKVDGFKSKGVGLGATFNYKIFPFRIDYIFLDQKFKIYQFETFSKVDYSDHKPIMAEFELLN